MKSEQRQESKSIQKAFLDLVEIIHRLRAPGGCPWDREQTPESLKDFVVEETYEVLDAIDGGDPGELCEELGDLLLQIVLQAEIAAERGNFTIEDVVKGISNKLILRHPHVFGDTHVDNSRDVLENWEKIKKKEKADKGLFDGLPSRLPGLQRAARIGEKAARVGFDWTSKEGVRDKVDEELEELDVAIASGQADEVFHEMGDLLFAIAQWARHLGIQPEEAVRGTSARFIHRFGRMESAVGKTQKKLADLGLEELEQLWQRAKSE